MIIEQNVPLGPLTTFGIGGQAYYFCRIKYAQDLSAAADFLKQTKLPFLVLGEGSNTLVSDDGFHGLVMKMEIRGVKVREFGEDAGGGNPLDRRFEIVAGAGENWDSIVETAVERGLYGIENLSGIPGTVGAAPVQNIGAYGMEVRETISFVEVFDLDRAWAEGKGKIADGKSGDSGSIASVASVASSALRILTPEECRFGYRDSIFKKPEARNLIITKVGLRLAKNGRVNIGYKDLRERFKDSYSKDVSLRELRDAVLAIRAGKFPDLSKVGTAGSFFKNPFIAPAHYERLREQWPDMPGFVERVPLEGSSLAHPLSEEKVKIPLAWILDHVCDLKGWRWGSGDGDNGNNDRGNNSDNDGIVDGTASAKNVAASPIGAYQNQPLVIVNFGGGTAAEVKAAASYIAVEVKKATDIDIEWEVRLVG